MTCLCPNDNARSGTRILLPHKHSHGVDTHVSAEEIGQNPVVIIAVCVFVGLYLIGLLFCRLYDNRDSREDVGLTVMSDLQIKSPSTKLYLITVMTGCNFWAGTTSAISIIMYGTQGRSRLLTLKDRVSTTFLKGDIDSFLVACDKDLGNLEKIRIWTDYTGIDPAWYCKKILIRPITTNIGWHFYVNRWLTISAEGSTVILEVPATTKEERTRFGVRFKENLMEQFDNANLWLSIFRHRPSSTFTRCQRLSCAFAILTVYLVLDIWFHGTEADDARDYYDFVGFSIDLRSVLQGLEIMFLSMPIAIILIALFRNVNHKVIPTLIIWENVIPAKSNNMNLLMPMNEGEKYESLPDYNRKRVQFPEKSDQKVFQLDSSDDSSMLPVRTEIDLHRDKFDGVSKASTVSGFSIPSTDIPMLEGWIEDRAQGKNSGRDGKNKSGVQSGAETDEDEINAGPHPPDKEFIQSVDSNIDTTTMDRLGRRALITSVRDFNPDTFIFQGENDIPEIEDLIDKQINENRTGGYGKPKKKKGDGEAPGIKGKKEIVLGKDKGKETKSLFQKVSEKTPWKKAVTEDYLDHIDQNLKREMENKQFMQDKVNWEAQLALEMCLLPQLQKRGLSWPWWFVYVAWFICLATMIVCLYLTLLLGLSYGYAKSILWLHTLVYSFLFSLFIGQPMHALFFTTVATLFGKTHIITERLQVIIEDSSNVSFLSSRLPYRFHLFTPIKPCEPLRGNEIFRLTIEARRQKELREKLLRLILCLLLIIPLIAVSYSGHNNYNYEVTHNIRSVFRLNGLGIPIKPFHSESTIYKYLEDVVVGNLHPDTLYNGKPVPPTELAFLSDRHTLLVGVARIRQQRVKSAICPFPLGMDNNTKLVERAADGSGVRCNREFKSSTQDRKNYNPRWQAIGTNPPPSSLTNNGWEFHGPKSKKPISWTFRGYQGKYGGGGYILELGRTRQESSFIINYMKKTQWLDRLTRAIFVEFTLLNPNINKFVDVVLLIERGSTGAITFRSWITPLELIPIEDLRYSDERAWVSICLTIIIVALFIWTCVFIYDVFITPKRRRLRISVVWLDFVIILFVIISLLISIVRFAAANDVANTIEKQKSYEYVSIQRAAFWNDINRNIFGVTQAIVFIKLWKLLMFTDQRFLAFALTLKLTSNYVMGFVLILIVLLCAFASSAFFLFGQDLLEYSSGVESMISLIDQILGMSFFSTFVEINPIMGPVFAILYGYFVIFLGLNFVVALLDLGVHEAKEVVNQRTVWLTYTQYFKSVFLKSIPFLRINNTVELDQRRLATLTPVHTDRWNGMKKETSDYIRAFLVTVKAGKMQEMQNYCNGLLAGTTYKMKSRAQKAFEKEEEKRRHVEYLRQRTSAYIKKKLGHNMTPKEFNEYAEFNRIILKLRIMKMEKKLELLTDKMDEFIYSDPSYKPTAAPTTTTLN